MKNSTTAILMLSIIVLIGCNRPPSLTSEVDLTMNPSGRTALSGVLTFSTDQLSRVTLTISDGENTSTVTPDGGYSTEHEVMVLGLRPGRAHTIDIAFENENGEAGPLSRVTAETPALPDHYPPIDVVLSRPARMEPGVTILQFARLKNQLPDPDFGLLLAVDAQGDVVWSYETDHGVDEARRMQTGNLLYQDFRTGVVEVDMLGRIVNRWHATETKRNQPESAIPIDAYTFHHDVLEMPSGNILVLATEPRTFDSYPTSEEDPDAPREPATVIGDVLIEFDRDGTKVREWKILDLLDPYRLGYGSLDTNFYREVYAEILEEPGYDWTHVNGIYYIAGEDAVIASSYHQSAVFKLDLGSGELQWILGPHDGWNSPWKELLLEPNGELTWQWYQHAPELTPHGTVLLFDNGSARAFPPDPPLEPLETYSRAVEYRIDEANQSVEELWSFGGPGEDWFYSGFVSDVDYLPTNDNVLVTVGGQVRKPDGTPGDGPPDGHIWATLYEVTHTTPAERVWEIVIDDPDTSWIVYRSERLPSLYP